MDRIEKECDEVTVFEGLAERTGRIVRLRALRSTPRGCTSMVDLSRKYRQLGDGTFYLIAGRWPVEESAVQLDRAKRFFA